MTDYSPARRHKRFSVQLTVVCATQLKRFPDRAVNVSRCGARIETPRPLAAGSQHRFYFIVPDLGRRFRVVDVNAHVAWAEEGAMGLSFDENSGIAELVSNLE
jgi:hypothetical protein